MRVTTCLSWAALAAFAFALTGRAGVFADFRFEGNLDSTGVAAPSLLDLGVSNGFSTQTVDGGSKTVFNFAVNTGLSLDVAALPDKDSYTMVALFKCTDGSPSYQRILQTKNFTSDFGLYWHGSGLLFHNVIGGPAGVHELERYEQVVLVTDGGNVIAYVDGALQFDAAADAAISSANLMHFFRDEAGENPAGAVARLRIYDTALTPLEVTGLDRLPAPAPVPEPAEYGAVVGLSLVGYGAWRRCRR